MNRTFLLASFLLLAACNAQQSQDPAKIEPEFRPIATVKDLMDSIVDPAADVVWDSVSTRITIEGTEEHAPKTDEEWANVRNHALQLVEATNLLLIPRPIARPGEKAASEENVELSPEEIQKLVDADRPTFNNFAHGLQDAAMAALEATNKKDVQALFDSGEGIEQACEHCHMKYWYPNDVRPQSSAQ
jgi:hypothetical protein